MRTKIVKTVGAMIVSNRAVLLGLRSPSKIVRPNCWDIIGGHAEHGESLDDALVREVKEEVGVIASQFRLIAIFRERQPERYGDVSHHVYAVTAWEGGHPVNGSDEYTELKWFSAREIRQLENIADAQYGMYARLAMTDGLKPAQERPADREN
jgi:8-oxo-dGTP pyrophosphatase MutT (NUDIX family)